MTVDLTPPSPGNVWIGNKPHSLFQVSIINTIDRNIFGGSDICPFIENKLFNSMVDNNTKYSTYSVKLQTVMVDNITKCNTY